MCKTYIYKDKFYRQIDGVAIGSPLGPTLANFCLGHIEKRVFGNENIDPDFYARYVDAIFVF